MESILFLSLQLQNLSRSPNWEIGMSGYIGSSTGTSPSPEMAPPPTQSIPFPTQSAEEAVVPVSPQTEDYDDDSIKYASTEAAATSTNTLGADSKGKGHAI
ncbi:hypothetical protein GBA52_008269 [Prunus armeniaca]|nr:hypothetical protein GBA52_008269 [Prunus armeniaca]